MSTEHQAWKNDPNYEAVHARRFAASLEWLRPHVRRGDRVLELGERSSFARRLEESTGAQVHASGPEDLRYLPQPEGDECGQLHAVLCMEVFEHLHDQECHLPTEWRATGTTAMLAAVFAALKPGGLLFLTTPNACSVNVLFKVLTMQAPMVYRPHVREYSPAEIAGMLKTAGFVIERFETFDVWGGGCSPGAKRLVEKLLADERHHSPHRGEDIFVLARKPNHS